MKNSIIQKERSMMADERVTTGDENRRKTECDDSDDDESEDKWFAPIDKKAEYAQSDEGGTDEASGQEDMQTSDKWGHRPFEEDCDIGSTESVAEYTQGDEGGTDEASVPDGVQSSSAKCSHPSVEDNAIGSFQLVAEYAKSDEGGIDEARGQDGMQSSDKWSRRPSSEGCDNGSTESMAEYAKSDEGGINEARGQDGMQSSDKWSRRPSSEGCDNGSTESMADYAQLDEGGKDEASGRDDKRSSSKKLRIPSVKLHHICNIQSDDVDRTFEQICQRLENSDPVLGNLLTRVCPQKAAEFIKQHLNRWETEKVRFAVAGRSATGKSTFINKFRGIKKGQDGFADVGFGDETEKISEYKNPLNENIIFCDLPGLSMKFNKRKFLKMVNLSSYNYIFIFFDSVLTEDDEWLTVQIQEKGIPFCLVRSKVDKDVESPEGRQIGEKDVLLKIREKNRDSMAENTAFAKAELFIISSDKPHIGEMSKLQDHIKEKLSSNLFSAVMLSLPVLTEAVMEKKLLELKKRIPFVSHGTAIITKLTSPFMDNPINIVLIKREVLLYVKVFGLDQKYGERIEGLLNNFSDVPVNDLVEEKIRESFDTYSSMQSFSLTAARNGAKEFVDKFLSDILSEIKQDAITVYLHFFKEGPPLASNHLHCV